MIPAEPVRIDPARVAELYAKHGAELRRLLLGMLREPHLADDVLQNTLAKAVELGHTAREETLKGWLFRVAVNEAMAARRRQAAGQKAIRGLAWCLPQAEDSPTDRLVQAETIELVRAALDELPPDQQRVVRMRIYEQKTFAVIAEELAVPLGTVLSRMQLAIEKLRRKLAQRI